MKAAKPTGQIKRFVRLFDAHAPENTPGFFFRHCLSIILLATLSTDGWSGKILRNRAIMWVGTVSYGIYLFHQPVSGVLHAALRNQAPQIATLNDALVTLLALVATLALAAVSWRFFEQPIVQYGQRVRYER